MRTRLSLALGLALAITGHAALAQAAPPSQSEKYCTVIVDAVRGGGVQTTPSAIESFRDEGDCYGVCGDSCCCGCVHYCCDLPVWDAKVHWMYMRREDPDAAPIFIDPAGVTSLNAEDFSFDYESGVDASVIFNRSCDWGVDVRYLWLDDHSAHRAFDVPPGENIIPTNPPTTFGGPTADPPVFDYTSEFQSAEFNLRQNREWVTLLYGFRFIEFNEQMGALFPFAPVSSPPFHSVLVWQTRNDLYGFQVGANSLIWERRSGLQVDGFAKAGIYYNDADSGFLGGRPSTPRFSADENEEAAFLGELGLYASYPLNDLIRVRGGYQVMWLAGVAVAADQVAATSAIDVGAGAIPSNIDIEGDVFYHGLNAGIEATW